MPLAVAAFVEAASSLGPDKEECDNHEDLLTTTEIEALKLQYSCLESDFFDRFVAVCKRHRDDTTKLLHDFVDFRQSNGWKLMIEETDIHPGVQQSGAHSLSGFTSETKLPIICCKLCKVNVQVATPKDFQLQCQYMIQEASKLHPQVAVTLDFENASFSILANLSSKDMTRGMGLFGTYPLQVKRVYVKNATALIRTAAKAVLAVAGHQARSKVTFLSTTETE